MVVPAMGVAESVVTRVTLVTGRRRLAFLSPVGLAGPVTGPLASGDGPRPDWQDIDGYRARARAAEGDPEALRKVAATWAAATGGVVSGDVMVLRTCRTAWRQPS